MLRATACWRWPTHATAQAVLFFSGQGTGDSPISGNSLPNYEPIAGEQRIGADARYASNVDGRAAFVALPRGNGVFVPASLPGNTGAASVDAGRVTNASLLTGHDYQITITGVTGNLQYSVSDLTASTTISTGTPFASGSAIDIEGQRVVVTGLPQPGDQFELKPAGQQSIFKTVDDAIALLQDPSLSSSQYGERLQAVQTSLDGALDRMSFLRTKVGEELNSTDAAFAGNSLLELQTEARRSDLRDLDYTRAVSDMQVNQTALQAALKSYASFARLSLFDSLN